jgi:citryl-CoA synthetase large subunit
MYAISKIILSKPGLKGVLVCGGTASNTRIDVTLGEGLVNALDDLAAEGKLDKDLIWVVRRGGPEVEKGLKLLAECFERNGIKGKIYDSELPITQAALILRDLLVTHRGYKPGPAAAEA